MIKIDIRNHHLACVKERKTMLPPKPRLLSVMEIVDQPQAKKSTKTNRRYPHRRGLERATLSFIIYLLVASRFTDSAETKTNKPPAGKSK